MSSIGPGLVFALTAVGPGSFVSNAAAGAAYGCSLIWALALTLAVRYVWLSTSAKYVLVTGESLLKGYGRIGRWFAWVVLGALVLVRHFSNLYKVVLFGSCADLLLPLPTKWSTTVWSICFVFLAFAMMFWGGYPAVERLCKLLIGAMGAALVVAAALSELQPAEIVKGILLPGIPEQRGLYSAILLLTALVGTEAGSMTNLTYSYFVYEKRWRDISLLKNQRLDLILSVGSMFVMGALLQIAAAGAVRPLGVRLESTEDLVRIFSVTQGITGRIIFSCGLLAAAFSGFVGGTTGYAMIARDICRNFIPRLATGGREQRTQDDAVYRWSIVFWSFSPLYILATNSKPVWLVLLYSSVVVLAIPILALALLHITNDRKLMGEHRNGWFTNSAIALLVVASLYLTARNAGEWWNRISDVF